MLSPPRDWSDAAGWNAYYEEEDPRPLLSSARYCDEMIASRGRVWFPGCGMDPGPALAVFVHNTG